MNPPSFNTKLGFGTAPGQIPDYPFGLKGHFPRRFTGKINIKHADANVLPNDSLRGATSIADNIIKLRAGPDGVDGTEDDTPSSRSPHDTLTMQDSPIRSRSIRQLLYH